jgi:peroxiredoxin
MVAFSSIGARSLEADKKAPVFEVPSTHGLAKLTDYFGKKHVVLAFYYADFSPT